MSEALKIENLQFRYSNSADSPPILNIKEFAVASGEKVFLQGESGSGKTTLLGLVTGILTAKEGSVVVLGENFSQSSNAKRDEIRGNKMGYVFQLFNLIPYLSVFQNIALPCKVHTERQKRLGGKNLSDEVKRLAEALGIATFLGSPVTELSVGQQQRVAAARALIGQPDLIIADEPTSALDHSQRGRFIELLMSECSKGKTSLLFVSHDPTLAKYFDRSVRMEELNTAKGIRS